jgi:signal transduction histidine kinase
MSVEADALQPRTTCVSMATPTLERPMDETLVSLTENPLLEWEALLVREVNRRVSEFIGIAGHELKTPLTAFKASVQLASRRLNRGLRPDGTGPYLYTRLLTETAEMLSYMDRQIDHLSQFVTDLLDVTRIYSGKFAMAAAPCDLAAIVRHVVGQQRLIWPARHVACDLEDAMVVPVLADGQRIGQVVMNFLTNALKYSPADLPVTVRLEVSGHEARVSVRDDGPGLPREAQAHIWERFHQVEGISEQGGPVTGLGLGLYVSRTIIEQHQGEVGVESTPGHGSTFWCSLPLAAPLAAPDGTEGRDSEGTTDGQHAGPAGVDR